MLGLFLDFWLCVCVFFLLGRLFVGFESCGIMGVFRVVLENNGVYLLEIIVL